MWCVGVVMEVLGMGSSKRWAAAAVLVAVLAAGAPAEAGVQTCLTGSAPGAALDAGQIWATRNAIDMLCPCDRYGGSPGWTRGAYRKCATAVVDSLIAGGMLRRQCRGTVRRMTAGATCGLDAASGVCVRERLATGKVTCAVKSLQRCTSVPGLYVESACAATHCIDAADSNGDLRITPADSGRCTGASLPTPTPTPRPGGPEPFPTGSGGERLAQLVNEYRVANGRAPIPLSQAMMTTAGAHVSDLVEHPGTFGGSCNPHSWSNQGGGLWTGCCYTNDHAQAACMWQKPAQLSSGLGFTRYPGNGYEIAFVGGGSTPEQVLQAFRNSPPHNDVLLNAGMWAPMNPFPAMGAAMRGGYAVVWFGDAADPWR